MGNRVELKSLEELRALLEKVKELYESGEGGQVGLLGPDGLTFSSQKGKKSEMADKIRLLEMIGELEDRIRGEEYKQSLLNGEV